jgi:hypothetical protein
MEIKVKDLKQLERGKTYIIQIPEDCIESTEQIRQRFNIVAKIYGCSFVFLSPGINITDLAEIIRAVSKEDKKQMAKTLRNIIDG